MPALKLIQKFFTSDLSNDFSFRNVMNAKMTEELNRVYMLRKVNEDFPPVEFLL